MLYTTEQLMQIGARLFGELKVYQSSFQYYVKKEDGFLHYEQTPVAIDFVRKINQIRSEVSWYASRFNFSKSAHLFAVIKLSKLACCSELVNSLVGNLLNQFEVDEFSNCLLSNANENHNFIAITSKEGQRIVIDPFFKIIDTWDNYFKHETLRAFFMEPACSVEAMEKKLNLQQMTQKRALYLENKFFIDKQTEALINLAGANSNEKKIEVLYHLASALGQEATRHYKNQDGDSLIKNNKMRVAAIYYEKSASTLNALIKNIQCKDAHSLSKYQFELSCMLYNLGVCNQSLQQHKEALTHFKEALEIRQALNCDAEKIKKITDRMSACDAAKLANI